uniref:Uncharacterized protein n=1 Tax=Oryza meridionalis TaxID=40149 RepID=A0A0E0CLR7_9ORYZ
MTQKNHHGNKCAEKDDQSFGMREEKAEDGRESADYKQKRVMDINRVTDKNCKSRKKDLESEYRFDCEDEEVQKQDKSSGSSMGRRRYGTTAVFPRAGTWGFGRGKADDTGTSYNHDLMTCRAVVFTRKQVERLDV